MNIPFTFGRPDAYVEEPACLNDCDSAEMFPVPDDDFPIAQKVHQPSNDTSSNRYSPVAIEDSSDDEDDDTSEPAPVHGN